VPAAERYRILDRLGAGGLGVVHRVRDADSGRILAMKVMPRASGAANLRGEFLALARLRHPNIIAVHDYGLTDSGQDYFTMDLVDGPPLLEAVAEVPSPAFYQLVGGILNGLAFVHSRGIVHADIKPSNILVDATLLATDPARAPRLADFGLAAAETDPGAGTGRGTFPYAAPEVYGGRLDARSDLYAFGIVLYEMLCGRKPYEGSSPADVIAAQRRGPPTPPHELRESVPVELSELVVALLDPAPGARPQTADEVLARINQIAGTDFDVEDTPPLLDMSTVFVGRDRDLGELRSMWDEARAGRGGVALIAGEEGIGKTRLAEELALAVKLEGGRVFTTALGGTAPFAGMAEMVRALLANLGERAAPRTAEWRRTLAPLFGRRSAPPKLDAQSRYALAEAVTAVVTQLAAKQPLLVIIDDLDRADEATADLVAYLARAISESPVLLVIGACDLDDAGGHAAAEQITESIRAAARGVRIDLPPLDRSSMHRLIEQAFGAELAESLARDLHRTSGGNPSHAAASLTAMVHNGAIARERGRWVLRADEIRVPLPGDAIEAALARAGELDEVARRVLAAGSVLGESFDREDVVALLVNASGAEQTDAAQLDRALADIAASRLALADAAAGSFRFAHPGVADAIYQQIEPDERNRLHQLAADRLEAARSGARPVTSTALARHLLALGDRRAAAEGLRAADERAASYDHHGALAWCERVRSLVADADRGAEVDERIGQLRALLGDVEGACAAYHAALDARADEPVDHVRLALELGELERRVGRGDEALAILMGALDEARRGHLSELEARCQLRLGWVLMYRADYKAATEHAVAGHMIARAGGHVAASAELGRLRGTIDIYRGDARTALDQLAIALTDAEAAGDQALEAGVLHAIGHAAIHAGDYPRASDALEKAIETSERTSNIEQCAKSLNNLGAACYFQGDWQRARGSWERFRRLCERLDERTELVRALSNLGSLYRELGQFTQAREALARAEKVASLTGHTHVIAMITANEGEVMFREGDIAGAREHYQRALAEFERIGAREDIIETRRRLCELDVATGKLQEAIDRGVDVAREARDAGTKLEEGILHRVIATALRLHADLESSRWFLTRARDILGELGSRYELAKVDLEAAQLSAATGELGEARRQLDQAIHTFSELGARWDLNNARARGRALLEPRARGNAPALGVELLLELTAALGNLDVERLLEVALDKLLEATTFERGFILLLDDEGRPSERLRRVRPGSRGFDQSEAEFSGTIVRRVAASGEAASVSDIAEEDYLRDQRSVVALGLRQIMCVPMRSRGRVIGIVYIDSRRLAPGEPTIELAFVEAFAAQVSLALENARLVAEERRQGELLAILAHEVRNPLAGIIGYADIGKESELGEEATDLFDQIRRDAGRLKRLVDNVLELARHEAGNVDWSMAPFDVSEIIEEGVQSYQPACDSRGIELSCEYESGGLHAMGNPDRIMQVLSNLIGNAVKFTPEGGRITVRGCMESVAATDPEAPPAPATEIGAWTPMEPTAELRRDYVRVDVIDTGPGMTEDVRTRLFEKFSQGAGRQRTRGVGLGLYISRNIILRHGGSIFVRSEPGAGSTFSFRLPATHA